MKFTFTIESDNDVFSDLNQAQSEIQRLLMQTSDQLGYGELAGRVYDINGNRVGAWVLESDS